MSQNEEATQQQPESELPEMVGGFEVADREEADPAVFTEVVKIAKFTDNHASKVFYIPGIWYREVEGEEQAAKAQVNANLIALVFGLDVIWTDLPYDPVRERVHFAKVRLGTLHAFGQRQDVIFTDNDDQDKTEQPVAAQ